MNKTNFTGKALERALSDETLSEEPSGTMSFDALVRKSENKDHVSEALAGCDSFADIPSVLIADVGKIGYIACCGTMTTYICESR